MSFFAEIRRRKVFQVAAVYAVVAWLIVQVVSTIEQPLNLPEWFATVVIVSLAIGFPVALILAWAFDITPAGFRSASENQSTSTPGKSPAGQRLSYLAQGLILLAVGFLVADQYLLQRGNTSAQGNALSTAISSGARVDLTEIVIGETEAVGNTGLSAQVDVSPDGNNIVYAAQRDGQTQLYLRPSNQLEARVIPSTEGAYHPRFSPDGEWVLFVTDGTDKKVKKVSVRGGSPQILADSLQAAGASWGSNDELFFATSDSGGVRRLFRISSLGGEPEILLSATETMWPVWPEPLPEGKAILFTMRRIGPAAEGDVGIVSLETGEYRTLIERAYNARYVPTGHVAFMRAGTLWAAPFDLEQLIVTGPEIPVIEGVESDRARGGAQFAFTNDGVLVYISGEQTGGVLGTYSRLDRNGNEEPLLLEPGGYNEVRISPDGRQLAFTKYAEGRAAYAMSDIWVHDLIRGTTSKLTSNRSAYAPVWSPDGSAIAFGSEGGIFRKRADGTGDTETLLEPISNTWPQSFTPDGRGLVFGRSDQIGPDIHLLSLDSDRESAVLVQSEFTKIGARISPDGRWLAYQSDDSGRFEIYVRPFPNVESGRWPVSSGGGLAPVWGPDSRELFYWLANGTVMVVTLEDQASFSAGPPQPLFETAAPSNTVEPRYDISPDGQYFVVAKVANQGSLLRQTRLLVIHNWFKALERLVAAAE